MKTIWKYPLNVLDQQTLLLPTGFQVLSVHKQHGQPCLWVLVDPNQPKVGIEVVICGTGNPAPEVQLYFVGTVIMDPFVWHVFIEEEKA